MSSSNTAEDIISVTESPLTTTSDEDDSSTAREPRLPAFRARTTSPLRAAEDGTYLPVEETRSYIPMVSSVPKFERSESMKPDPPSVIDHVVDTETSEEYGNLVLENDRQTVPVIHEIDGSADFVTTDDDDEEEKKAEEINDALTKSNVLQDPQRTPTEHDTTKEEIMAVQQNAKIRGGDAPSSSPVKPVVSQPMNTITIAEQDVNGKNPSFDEQMKKVSPLDDSEARYKVLLDLLEPIDNGMETTQYEPSTPRGSPGEKVARRIVEKAEAIKARAISDAADNEVEFVNNKSLTDNTNSSPTLPLLSSVPSSRAEVGALVYDAPMSSGNFVMPSHFSMNRDYSGVPAMPRVDEHVPVVTSNLRIPSASMPASSTNSSMYRISSASMSPPAAAYMPASSTNGMDARYSSVSIDKQHTATGGTGRRKIHLHLEEEIEMPQKQQSGILGHIRTRSKRMMFGSDSLPSLDGIQFKVQDKGALTISWFDGTSSIELQEHVRKSIRRKLQLPNNIQIVDLRLLDESVNPPDGM
jgi:hypothetical protein